MRQLGEFCSERFLEQQFGWESVWALRLEGISRMARIRTVKPGLWKHEDLSALPLETHVLAAALLNYADDEGYFNAHPKLIIAECFPLRELSMTIPVMLHELVRTGYVRLFKGTDGKNYGHVCKFLDHQVVSHPKKSTIKPLEDSSKPPVTVQSESVMNGIELNGTEEEEELKETLVRSAHTNSAELVYAGYPRKIGHGKAIAGIKLAIKKLQKELNLSEGDACDFLRKSVLEFARSPAGNKGDFTPHCATWMNQERWNDDRAEWHREATNANQSGFINRGRARIDAQRAELARAEELDQETALNLGDFDEGNDPSGSPKRLCVAAGGSANASVTGGIQARGHNPEILPKTSRTS